MQHTSPDAERNQRESGRSAAAARRRDDLTYQAFTIAVVLSLLLTLWAF